MWNLQPPGRLALGVDHGTAVDVETASGGRFSADVQAVFDRWDEFCGWARGFWSSRVRGSTRLTT